MKLIAGLGNPGVKYSSTRHNMGFMVVDVLAARLRAREAGKRWRGVIAQAESGGETIILLKPHTFMNNSGVSVGMAVRALDLPLSRLLVVCDDLALPLGMLRFRTRGSSGGQKGLESIICDLVTDNIPRLRVGIEAETMLTAREYVLRPFATEQQQLVEKVIQRAVAGCITWLTQGIDDAMNLHNGFIPELEGNA